MADIPRSAIESAVHQENQAVREAEPKSWIDKIADKVTEKIKDAPAGIFGGQVEIAENIINGGQQAYNNMFFGEHIRSGASQAPDNGPGIHGENRPAIDAPKPTVDVTVNVAGPDMTSFADLMKAQAAMLPQRDEPAPEQEHDVQSPER